jgi:hypothetical protein
MRFVLLAAWLVEAAVGLTLVVSWLRTKRHQAGVVAAHVAPTLVAVGLWTSYVVTERVLWGWIAFGIITVSLGFGDAVLLGRTRRLVGPGGSLVADYRNTVGAMVRGRHPQRVIFHAAFSPVVYFGTLAACVAASL